MPDLAEMSDSEFRAMLRDFTNKADDAIEAYAVQLDASNATRCTCAYHTGRASVLLEQKLDASTRAAAEVIRKAQFLTQYSVEMRDAIVSACEQIAEWTMRNVEAMLGTRVELKAPMWGHSCTPRERRAVPSERAEVVCTSPAVKGTH